MRAMNTQTEVHVAAEAIISVACCVFPDGTAFWSDDLDVVPRIVELWRESEYGRSMPTGCMGGVVYVRMPRSSYSSITTIFPNPIAEGLMHDAQAAEGRA